MAYSFGKFPVKVSARHIHLRQETLEKLFGAGHQVEPANGPARGQFLSTDRVTVVGPKKSIEKVSILGPARAATQVEVSLTDARTLGITAPVRESADVKGSAPCKIIGPCGEVDLEEGVIIAKRHVHMTPEDAEAFGVHNGQIVNVEVEQETGRKIIFGDTVVRVSPKYALAMHIDTDEANAAACSGEITGRIVG